MQVKLTFCGGVESVTGANFLFEAGGRKILVDCGMIQGSRLVEEQNHNPFPYDPKSIDILLVTHAHLDHVGRIPKLVKEGFAGKIYSTSYTRDLGELVMHDAVRLLAGDAAHPSRTGHALPPLYVEHDVNQAMSLWQSIDYHAPLDLGGGLSATAKDAGHILGSSMYEISAGAGSKKIVFTGDLGNTPSLLVRDTEPITGANYLVMESVYGDRSHQSKADRRIQLCEALADTIKRGGTAVVPAFSLERTQDLLYELNTLIESNELPSVPVFLDSPMAIKATAIYERAKDVFNDAVKARMDAGEDVFSFPKLRITATMQDSAAIMEVSGPKIILAGSGMSVGGRVRSHEKHFLGDAKNSLILVGYQTPGSLGRRLADGAKEVKIDGETIAVHAKVTMVEGYSAHKDRDGLLAFVETAQPTLEKVFVCMGEPKTSLFLAQRIKDFLSLDASVPRLNEAVQFEL